MNNIITYYFSRNRVPATAHYEFYRSLTDDMLLLVLRNAAKEGIYPFIWN